MATGTVRWFSVTKRYGFITPDEGDREVFVHLSTLTAASIPYLDDGTRVSFDVEATAERIAAVNLAVLVPDATGAPLIPSTVTVTEAETAAITEHAA